MTKQFIEMGKKYKTRTGLPVRILAVDLITKEEEGKDNYQEIYPVVAAITNDSGSETVETYTSLGYSVSPSHTTLSDLLEVTPCDLLDIDDPVVITKGSDTLIGKIAHFAGLTSEGDAKVWIHGRTSMTVEDPDFDWWTPGECVPYYVSK